MNLNEFTILLGLMSLRIISLVHFIIITNSYEASECIYYSEITS